MADVRTRRPGEIAFSVMLVVFSTVSFWQSYAISGLTGLSEPGVFPMLTSATMLVSAIFIMRQTMARNALPAAKDSGISRFMRTVLPGRLVAMIGFILAYVISMPFLGFLASSTLFLFASFCLLWRKNVFIALALTALSLSVIYIVFRQVFRVVLPQGTLLQGLF